MTLARFDMAVGTLLKHWVTFVKAHEKLVLIVVASLLLFHFGEKAFTALDGRQKLAATQVQNQKDALIAAANTKTLEDELAQLKITVDAQKKVLDAKIVASQQQVVIQQKTDAALPLPDLAQRWETLLVLQAGSITPQPNGTIAVTTDAAHVTVNELDKVGPLTDQVVDLQLELKGCTDVRSKQEQDIADGKVQLAVEQKGRADDAKIAKDAQHKSFWKGTKFGAIVTAVAITAIKLATIL